MSIFNVFTLMGGIAMFLYGMDLMGKALEQTAGSKLQGILSKMTASPVRGLLLAARTGCWAMAARMGRISVTTVHSAEMPITPAPRNRALLLHNCSASALSVCPSANVDEAISQRYFVGAASPSWNGGAA